MSDEVQTQEEALLAYRKRQKGAKKKHKVIKFIWTPEEGEEWDKAKKKMK